MFVRDHRSLSRTPTRWRWSAWGSWRIPALLPASLSEVNGAKIWIRLAGFSIQPGEFAKICLVVFFAAYLVDKRDVLALASRKVVGLELPRGRDLGPVLVAWMLSILVLVFERDLGSSLLLFGIFVVMLYVATERASWLLIGVVLFAVGAFVAYQVFGSRRAPASTSGSTRSPTRTAPATSWSSRCSAWAPAACSAPASAAAAPTRCRWPRATSSPPPSARSWACSASSR